MENPTTAQRATRNAPQDERAEWISPAITDYDIESVTQNGPYDPSASFDGGFGYS